MHPVLIKLGNLTVYSYGFFISAAFLLGIAWTMREAEKKGLKSALVLDAGFYFLLGALSGALLASIAQNPGLLSQGLAGIFKIWQAGLNFAGGAVGALVCNALYLRRKGENVRDWLDALVPGASLGVGVGWLGCLASGAGYGKPADLAWSIMFTHPESAAPLFENLHPVQAYHAGAALLIFVLVTVLRSRFSRSGGLAGLFMMTYTAVKLGIDQCRADLTPELYVLAVNYGLALIPAVWGCYLLFASKTSRTG